MLAKPSFEVTSDLSQLEAMFDRMDRRIDLFPMARAAEIRAPVRDLAERGKLVDVQTIWQHNECLAFGVPSVELRAIAEEIGA